MGAQSDRPQSLGEEIANSISHGLALLAALVATPFLVLAAAQRGDTASLVGVSIFAATMVLLYTTSMLYHALPPTPVKKVFQILDHGAIYLLIAGTYTPFTLGVLRGPWGWTLFGLVWAMALAGVTLKAVAGIRYPRASTALYLAMGWIAIIAVKPMWELVPGWGLFWLLAGGLAYTLGVIFFVSDSRWRYGHFVWHLFVAAGTACHVVAVWGYAG
ncbi:PAQR family membrane homeostasis protein TrhA [Polaromonas sp. SM01]|uniref:PAQR family membrane homeostasis protein TrhA n=1 Tax=Polaromonas sp. SM01 TaxID=3085630 RepID=UPI0029818604|nr:hemolysin III family protein [Polaromonas sp. SM01]MDW5443214.1 hemolysin III family protein [Polaromonas sp. SM01]